jgi:prepilin-type processing-associated H-X9-DG protein
LIGRSERNAADALAPMGMGATDTLGRVCASLGLVDGSAPVFNSAADLANAGVLFAVPALLSNGLFHHVEECFRLPRGYYTLQQLFLLVAFLALCRIKCLEQLRYVTPGEWGKILGLDRIPEVKTLREKIAILSTQGTQQWSSLLCKEWMETDPSSAGVLYVDGHVRVYHGSKTVLPRHYVARQRLCLRATVDYWVNAMDGKPFFRINQTVDPGLLTVLRDEIIPLLERDVPGQPTEQQLHADALLHRFTVIIDREGYSPGFFNEMKHRRIAIITYHKFAGPDWPIEEFVEYSEKQTTGETITVSLAERGTRLSNGLWVREVRKLTESSHQTALVSTDYRSDLRPIATELFSRWCQENFFKYMRENYNIDRLIEYRTEPIPDTVRVVNPRFREVDGKLRSSTATLSRRLQEFGALHLSGDIESENVQRFEKQKAELQGKINDLRTKIERLKEERKGIPHHITADQLPREQRFDQLRTHSKHLVDTIKLIAYRAETALASILKEHLADPDDARRLVKRICTGEADMVIDAGSKTLMVRLHHQTCSSLDAAVAELCKELNATETIFPGTDLRLVYRIIESSA